METNNINDHVNPVQESKGKIDTSVSIQVKGGIQGAEILHFFVDLSYEPLCQKEKDRNGI